MKKKQIIKQPNPPLTLAHQASILVLNAALEDLLRVDIALPLLGGLLAVFVLGGAVDLFLVAGGHGSGVCGDGARALVAFELILAAVAVGLARDSRVCARGGAVAALLGCRAGAGDVGVGDLERPPGRR